jgi:NTE family protein
MRLTWLRCGAPPESSRRALKIAAVDAESGEPRVFEKSSDVSLVDAIAVSCSVPGVWPPGTIDGCRYIDGGVRYGAYAEYADGASRVQWETSYL